MAQYSPIVGSYEGKPQFFSKEQIKENIQQKGCNGFLLENLDPREARPSPAPAISLTPASASKQNFTDQFDVESPDTDAAVVSGAIIAFPYSKNLEDKVFEFVQDPSDGKYVFKKTIQPSVNIEDYFSLGRVTSFGMSAKSSTISSTNFTLQGTFLAVNVLNALSFKDMDYKTLASFAYDKTAAIVQETVATGVMVIAPPVGSYQFSELRDETVVVTSPRASTFSRAIYAFGAAPNPIPPIYAGWSTDIDQTTGAFTITKETNTVIFDTNDQVVGKDSILGVNNFGHWDCQMQLAMREEPLGNTGLTMILTIAFTIRNADGETEYVESIVQRNDTGTFQFNTGLFQSRTLNEKSGNPLETGELVRIKASLNANDGTAGDINTVILVGTEIRCNFYDAFQWQEQFPASIILYENMIVGQQVLFNAWETLDVIPDENLSRVVEVQTEDDTSLMDYEITKAVFSNLTPLGLRTVYNLDHFNYLANTGYFRSLSYRQALPAIARMLMGSGNLNLMATGDEKLQLTQYNPSSDSAETQVGKAMKRKYNPFLRKVVKAVPGAASDLIGLLDPMLRKPVKKTLDTVFGVSGGTYHGSAGAQYTGAAEGIYHGASMDDSMEGFAGGSELAELSTSTTEEEEENEQSNQITPGGEHNSENCQPVQIPDLIYGKKQDFHRPPLNGGTKGGAEKWTQIDVAIMVPHRMFLSCKFYYEQEKFSLEDISTSDINIIQNYLIVGTVKSFFFSKNKNKILISTYSKRKNRLSLLSTSSENNRISEAERFRYPMTHVGNGVRGDQTVLFRYKNLIPFSIITDRPARHVKFDVGKGLCAISIACKDCVGFDYQLIPFDLPLPKGYYRSELVATVNDYIPLSNILNSVNRNILYPSLDNVRKDLFKMNSAEALYQVSGSASGKMTDRIAYNEKYEVLPENWNDLSKAAQAKWQENKDNQFLLIKDTIQFRPKPKPDKGKLQASSGGVNALKAGLENNNVKFRSIIQNPSTASVHAELEDCLSNCGAYFPYVIIDKESKKEVGGSIGGIILSTQPLFSSRLYKKPSNMEGIMVSNNYVGDLSKISWDKLLAYPLAMTKIIPDAKNIFVTFIAEHVIRDDSFTFAMQCAAYTYSSSRFCYSGVCKDFASPIEPVSGLKIKYETCQKYGFRLVCPNTNFNPDSNVNERKGRWNLCKMMYQVISVAYPGVGQTLANASLIDADSRKKTELSKPQSARDEEIQKESGAVLKVGTFIRGISSLKSITEGWLRAQYNLEFRKKMLDKAKKMKKNIAPETFNKIQRLYNSAVDNLNERIPFKKEFEKEGENAVKPFISAISNFLGIVANQTKDPRTKQTMKDLMLSLLQENPMDNANFINWAYLLLNYGKPKTWAAWMAENARFKGVRGTASDKGKIKVIKTQKPYAALLKGIFMQMRKQLPISTFTEVKDYYNSQSNLVGQLTDAKLKTISEQNSSQLLSSLIDDMYQDFDESEEEMDEDLGFISYDKDVDEEEEEEEEEEIHERKKTKKKVKPEFEDIGMEGDDESSVEEEEESSDIDEEGDPSLDINLYGFED